MDLMGALQEIYTWVLHGHESKGVLEKPVAESHHRCRYETMGGKLAHAFQPCAKPGIEVWERTDIEEVVGGLQGIMIRSHGFTGPAAVRRSLLTCPGCFMLTATGRDGRRKLSASTNTGDGSLPCVGWFRIATGARGVCPGSRSRPTTPMCQPLR